jgi:hypothetical protein
MPGKHLSGVDVPALLNLGILLLVVFFPLILNRRGHPPGPSDSDSDDGWGNGPKAPPPGPDDPRGGIPLDDAVPARVRLRGHARLMDALPARPRRRTREPDRGPVRQPSPGWRTYRD